MKLRGALSEWGGCVIRCGGWVRSLGRSVLLLLGCLWVLAAASGPALALKAVLLDGEQDVVEITGEAVLLGARGDSIQVETAPDADGMTGRMSVRASAQGLSPNWMVFALRNTSSRPIERWVTAERYSIIGSGIVWPDLDARRIEALTPSLGFLPERVRSDRADIFRITLEPGQSVTYVAELSSDRFARVHVWKPLEYELKARDRQLYNGILLGITGVLGIFLTAVFAANHKPIFPSAALVTWCVLAYLCVDFGFWHKLFQLRPDDNAVYRAATEAAMAASLLVFVYIFLRLSALPALARMLLIVWIIVQIALVGLAAIDARLAATFSRASFAAIGGLGILVAGFLALRGQDRALALLPSWILFLVWLLAATVTLTGRLHGDAVVSSLSGGLVLITVLLGFTVTQFAFRSLDTAQGTSLGDQHVRSLAIEGAGASIWEWNSSSDIVQTGPLIEASLGLSEGDLTCKSEVFFGHLHPADRERFRLLMWSVKETGGGEIRLEFRMLHAENSYRWFDLEAGAVPATDRRSLKCVGLIRDITEDKRAQERLLHDAVHDSLTGLPNRELIMDRLGVAVMRAQSEPMISPAMVLIDVDKFRNVNATFGLVVADSLLLTLARRLQRYLGRQDTLARVGGNQFAILVMQAHDVAELAGLAENVRRAVRAPIGIAGQEVVLTAAIGIALWDRNITKAEDLVRDAEVALYRAKRGGADTVETFRPEMRQETDNRIAVESELRAGLERRELTVLYQPVVALATEELAGFEALVRWQHPRLGMLGPGDFVPIAEESDLIVKLGSFVLARAAEDAVAWQKHLPRTDRPLFVSVNVSSRQLFRADLVQEIRQVLGRTLLAPGGLRLELTESLVMENPERAVEVLDLLKATGAGLSLDDFGTGYSSLAYLNRFPFDTIKIDKDIVQASTMGSNGAAILRSIVALSHELGKKVVAEGVELAEDVGLLRFIHCEYAQGYYYGEPMTQRDVERMLRAIRKNERRMQRVGFFAGRKRREKDGPQGARAQPPRAAAAAAVAAMPPPVAPVGAMMGTPGRAAGAVGSGDVPGANRPPPVPGGTGSGRLASGPPPHEWMAPDPVQMPPLPPGSIPQGMQPPADILPGLAALVAATDAVRSGGSVEADAERRAGDLVPMPANANVPHGGVEAQVYDGGGPPVGASFGPAVGAVGGDRAAGHDEASQQSPHQSPRAPARPADLSNLPPAIAASLQRLARGKQGSSG
jgi:diguanylate cyclase (GGDEF)-like protein/PAS domain S-box-containing protein